MNPHGDDSNSLRMVHVANPDLNMPYQYCDNTIITAKYSLIPLSLHFVIYKNLFEQFQKAANVYFLCISIMQVIPGLSPTGQYTTLLPLSLVVFLTLVKDFWEDWKRRSQDTKVNGKRAHVFREMNWKETTWSDVQVGDLVLVKKNESIPADLVCVWSSEPEGNCERERQLRVPLGPENVLLRGSDVRNVKLVIGVAVFTGEDSKLAKNMTSKHYKMSRMDNITNRQIFFVFIFQIILAVICTIGYRVSVNDFENSWFLTGITNKSNAAGLQFVTFVILFNSFIPISLYIMMEVVKVIQASMINNDIAMYSEVSNTPADVRNTKLNEEFGQVEYIFSDKTGTLTCNRMEFRRFSVTST
ncbi:P-type H+-ATPase, putative, partial [Bodo saltans]